MGTKDTSEKYLESFNDVFADIYNVLLFGEEVIQPDTLRNGSTEMTYKAENSKIRSQSRDFQKNYNNSNIQIASLGIENQSAIDRDMPIRVMGYDYTTYRSQIDSGELIRFPVITIVLNFSNQKWEYPTSLLDILEVPDELKDYVQNYEIKVYDVAYLSKEIRDKFKSDFKVVADFFSERRTKTYRPENHTEEIKHVEAVLELFRVFIDDERYEEIKQNFLKKNNKGGRATMCELLDEIEMRGERKGERKGEILAFIKMVFKNKITVEEVCNELNMTQPEFEKKMAEYQEEIYVFNA